jgi:ribosome-binding factor A
VEIAMGSRRLLKAAEAIREVVSMAILTELRDPRIQNVTVTHVEMSPDMRHAKVHVSVMGDEGKERLALRGLEHASGFLQQKVARRIETRYTPRLHFVLDKGVKHSLEVARILRELFPGDSLLPPDAEPESDQDYADADLAGEHEAGMRPADDQAFPDVTPDPSET